MVVLYAFLVFISGFFAFMTARKYNNVVVFGKEIRKPAISNSWWIAYFLMIVIRSLINTFKFSFIDDIPLAAAEFLVISGLCMNGFCTWGLTQALNHQYKHRSTFVFERASSSSPFLIQSSVDLLPNNDSTLECIKLKLFRIESIFLALLLCFIISVAGLFVIDSNVLYYLFIACFALQKLPVFILLIMIFSIFPQKDPEGPTVPMKVCLVIGVLMDLVNSFPVSIWQLILPNGEKCILQTFSYIDIVHFLYFLAQILIFLFIRHEFYRNKEPCIYTTVQNHQNTEKIDLGIGWKNFSDDSSIHSSRKNF
uniref:Uncharacterized protein n=1 Tax=Arcella intermedia TaxID=1963864 RepID=A0A6B2LA55_9EUKA